MAIAQSGILAVNRQSLLRLALKNGKLRTRPPALPMTHEQVFSAYRGFDGTAWPEPEPPPFPIVNGLARPKDLVLVENYTKELRARDECDIIGLAIAGGREFEGRDSPWIWAGFDVGFFESQWSHYSTILNEVVFGAHSALRAFAKLLNQALLFESDEQVASLLALRAELARGGADVEESQSGMQRVSIYVLKSRQQPALLRH